MVRVRTGGRTAAGAAGGGMDVGAFTVVGDGLGVGGDGFATEAMWSGVLGPPLGSGVA